jgi:hypothetical protein
MRKISDTYFANAMRQSNKDASIQRGIIQKNAVKVMSKSPAIPPLLIALVQLASGLKYLKPIPNPMAIKSGYNPRTCVTMDISSAAASGPSMRNATHPIETQRCMGVNQSASLFMAFIEFMELIGFVRAR